MIILSSSNISLALSKVRGEFGPLHIWLAMCLNWLNLDRFGRSSFKSSCILRDIKPVYAFTLSQKLQCVNHLEVTMMRVKNLKSEACMGIEASKTMGEKVRASLNQ